MNKKLLTLGFAVLAAISLNAQISINRHGVTEELNHSLLTINPTDGSEQILEIQVHNQSTKNQDWYVVRQRITVPAAGWDDNLCWGPEGDPLGGACYSSSQMPNDYWASPDFATINAGFAGTLQIHVNPDDNIPGYGHYRYYIASDVTMAMDSFDLVISRITITGDLNGNGIIDSGELTGDINGDNQIGSGEILGDINGDGNIGAGEVAGDANGNGVIDNGETFLNIKKVKAPFTFSLYPNPATDYLLLTTTNNQEGNIRIVDVLGKEVMSDKLANKKYSVRELKNGVYILTVTSEGNTYSRRFVVKHD